MNFYQCLFGLATLGTSFTVFFFGFQSESFEAVAGTCVVIIAIVVFAANVFSTPQQEVTETHGGNDDESD